MQNGAEKDYYGKTAGNLESVIKKSDFISYESGRWNGTYDCYQWEADVMPLDEITESQWCGNSEYVHPDDRGNVWGFRLERLRKVKKSV